MMDMDTLPEWFPFYWLDTQTRGWLHGKSEFVREQL